MRRPALLIVFAALFCGNTRAQDGILTGFNPGPSYTPGFDGIVVAVAPTDPNAGPTQFDVGKTIRLDVWWNSVDRLPNIASTFRFHVDTPGAQIVNEFGALDTCAPFLGGGQVASLGGGGDVFSYFFRYSTPGIKTIAVTVSICSGGFNPAKVAVLGQAGTIQVGGPSSAQITPQALNFPGSLNPIIVPPGGGQLSTPLNLKLGQHFSLEYDSINPQTGQQTPIPSTMTFQNQQTATLGNLSKTFADPTVLFPNNVLLHFTAPTPDEFLAVHSGNAVIDIKPNDPNSSAPEVFLTVNINSCPLGQSCGISLGTTKNKFDDDIVRFGDFRGIPPQIIKSQIDQEATTDQLGEFNAATYRYEPLMIDFPDFYQGQNLRVDPRFQEYRFKTFPDSVNRTALTGGQLMTPTNEAPRENLFVKVDSKTGAPLADLTVPVSNTDDRQILPGDSLVSMENILFTNDGTHVPQNWTTAPGGQRYLQDYLDYRQGGTPFVGQTELASSYGLLQVSYETAVDRLMFTLGDGTGSSPDILFDPQTSIDLGTEFVASKFPSIDPFSVADFGELQTDFGTSLSKYNRDPQYPAKVLGRVSNFSPQ